MDNNDGTTGNNEPLPYLEPAVEHQATGQNDDYEDLPLPEMYENPMYEAPGLPYEYETSATTAIYEESNEEPYVESLPNGEQVYEDPGYIAENIYAWFEEKKFRKLKKDEIRFVNNTLITKCSCSFCIEHFTILGLVNLV